MHPCPSCVPHEPNCIQAIRHFDRKADERCPSTSWISDSSGRIGDMEQQWTLEDIIQCHPTPQKVLPKDSTAYIRDPKDLLACRGLYNVLKPYRAKYTWWQYQFLCHLVLSSTHDSTMP